MIDWHAHILPGMDDGSRDIEESLTLLHMLSEQGVDTVVATPHFYANDESVDDFIKRRLESYESLCSHLPEISPRILLGAEVRYYAGIGKMSSLKRLCIEGTKLLMLEMPMEKWTDYTVKELTSISNTGDINLILAHIDRYLPFQNTQTFSTLYEADIKMQVNASFFIEAASKRRAIKTFLDGEVHAIGSDCHSVSHRPPQLDKALQLIRKKANRDFIDHFNGYGYHLLDLI